MFLYLGLFFVVLFLLISYILIRNFDNRDSPDWEGIVYGAVNLTCAVMSFMAHFNH